MSRTMSQQVEARSCSLQLSCAVLNCQQAAPVLQPLAMTPGSKRKFRKVREQ